MRSFLSVGVMLALCLIFLDCTVTGDVIKDGNPGSERQDSVVPNVAVVTTTTTAAVKVLPDQVDDQVENLEKQEEKAQEKEPEARLEHDVNAHRKDDKTAALRGQQSEDDLKAAAAAIVTTTTTAANTKPLPLQDASQPEAKITTTAEETYGDHTNTVNPGEQVQQVVEEADVSHRDAAQNPAGQKIPEVRNVSTDLSDVKGPSITEVKSHTATATVEKLSGPKGDTGKKQSNGHAKKETPNVEVKDAIQAGQTTDTAVTKRGGESAQSTPPSGGATGGKKEQKASLVPSGTTDTTEKKDNHAAITHSTNTGEKEIIQEQKQKSTTTTTTEPTTSTGAPTTTLSKGFKLPQSLDKTDGSKSSSVLIAFVTVVTFLVIAVTPLY